MAIFKDMKVKTKFIIMILTIGLLVLALSFIGVTFLRSSNKQYDTSIKTNKEVVEQGIESISNLIDFRAVVLRLDSSNSSLGRKEYDNARTELKQVYDTAKSTLTEYEKLIKNINENESIERTKELSIINEINMLIDDYYKEYSNHIDMHEQGVFDTIEGEQKHIEHSNLTRDMADKIFGKVGEVGYIFQLPNTAFNSMVDGLESVYKSSSVKTIVLLIIAVIIIVLLITFSLLLSISITKPIDNIILAANKVANGNLNIDIRTNSTNEFGKLSNSIDTMSNIITNIIDDINELSYELEKGNLSYRIDCGKYEGAFKQATNAINNATSGIIEDTNYIVGTIAEIGNGNFESEIRELSGDKIVATNSLRNVQNELKYISEEIKSLINAAKEGNLEYKINTKGYKGAWKDTTTGLNEFTESIVIPIKEAQNALKEFAKGNFSYRITNEYKGEFNNIKETVNFTAETIGSYISEISSILTRMSEKDFNISIDKEYLGDFEEIKNSLLLIIKNLNILTRDIIASAEQVSVGAKQISETSISLAEGATEQAETVERLNQNIRQISEQTALNTHSSNKANELALKTRENASSGTEQMNKMLLAMEEINIAANSISSIIKVIDDIAFQTNILALNAAVEAARAGEHGKGFAVVAEEVRSLASRSQQVAKETTELIESSVSKVEEGYKIANITGEELQRIVEEIEEISNLVNKSTLASESQEEAINEIVISIGKISSVTQTNTVTSEESAAAEEELASQSEVFYSSVADFKLKDTSEVYSDDDIYKKNTLKGVFL